jgi:hypothetical protein
MVFFDIIRLCIDPESLSKSHTKDTSEELPDVEAAPG